MHTIAMRVHAQTRTHGHGENITRVAPNVWNRFSPLTGRALRTCRRVGGNNQARKQISASSETSSLSWDTLKTSSQEVLGTYSIRGYNQVPSSSPEPSLPTLATATTDKRVLLYRDTNAWCPFCERVWLAMLEKGIDYDTVFIDLRDKPDWYKEMVPTALVPAARIDGELVWESSKILEKLEEAFPDTPLYPVDEEQRAHVMALVEAFDSSESVGSAGYRFLRGAPFGEPVNEAKVPEMKVGFVEKIRELEEALAKFPGPYFGLDFSVADVCAVPALERLGANLSFARSFDIRTNPEFPHMAEWFAAMSSRPAYQKVMTDDATHNMVVRRIFGMQAESTAETKDHAALDAAKVSAARMEAGAKLAENHEAVVADIMKNSGLEANDTNEAAVNNQMMKLAAVLTDQPIPTSPAPTFRPDPSLSEEERKVALQEMEAAKRLSAKENAAGAAALAFVRNRVSAPRDMSAEAATQFRAAAEKLLQTVY